MRKKLEVFLFVIFCLLFPRLSLAQNFTTVSMTITDPHGVPYSYGVVSGVLSPSTPGGYVLGSFPYAGFLPATALDITGSVTVNMGSNAAITPAGSQWLLTVQGPNVPPPLGNGIQSFTVLVSISGATQNISTTVSAAAPALANAPLSITLGGIEYPFTQAGLGAAITAAGSFNTINIPAGATISVSSGSGYSFPLGLFIRCQPGAQFNWTQSSGTLFTVGTATNTTWTPTGIEGCTFNGAGGASDTSVAVQIGNGTNSAHGFTLVADYITGFGNGVVSSGNGDDFAISIDRTRIGNSACNGILFNNSPETWHITDTVIFNNGLNQNNCTGINVAGGGLSPALELKSLNIDGNGKNVGQIWVQSGSAINLYMANIHSEHTPAGDVPFLQSDGTGANISQIAGTGLDVIQNRSEIVPIIQAHSGVIAISASSFHQVVGASVTPIIDMETDQQTRFVSAANSFICGGTVANCQVFKMPNGSGSNRGTYGFVATSLDPNFNLATNLTNIGTGAPTQSPLGCHDLVAPNAFNGGPSGNWNCTGAFTSIGTPATLSGTGACATITTQSGGSWAGKATCTGATGVSTFVITPGWTAPNGWSCSGSDTTAKLLGAQSGVSTTTCTLTWANVTQNDVITFNGFEF